MMRRPAESSFSSQALGSLLAVASSISSTGPGAPPCSGPLSAAKPATTHGITSEPVEATTRAANVDAFRPWSDTVSQ
jgi:hypothetical protein